MKNVITQLTERLFVFVIFVLLLGFAPSYGQIGTLGIYGAPTISFRANVRYVLLEDYPACECNFSYIIPTNGHKNFNFYYTPDGTAFLPGGGYKVSYLAADQSTVYGYDIVTYSPNSGHTNGVGVRAFYDPPATPRGVHGLIRAVIAGGGGTTTPLQNATVYITAAGGYSEFAKSNGDGFYSIYYANTNPNVFVPDITHWNLFISGSIGSCVYADTVSDTVVWQPNTDITSSNYYINAGSEFDVGTRTITSLTTGCAP